MQAAIYNCFHSSIAKVDFFVEAEVISKTEKYFDVSDKKSLTKIPFYVDKRLAIGRPNTACVGGGVIYESITQINAWSFHSRATIRVQT